jgi:hypothetical protein
MNFGFNSNVRVGDALYHVQTEDRGPAHPFLDTVVYLSGRVVYKRKTSYEKFLKGAYPESLAQKLHERLARQHREVIAELEAGSLPFQSNEKEKAKPAAEGGGHESLHSRLINPQSWLAAGNVTLEIELSEVNLKQRIGGADIQASVEHEKHRLPCGNGQTNAKGLATLKFPMPSNLAEGSSLVVRASDGSRRGELRFRLKVKPSEEKPAPVAR